MSSPVYAFPYLHARSLPFTFFLCSCSKSQEQAVAILGKLPNSERALARAIFYCSTYQQDHGKTVDEEVDKESFRLYQKHAGAKAKAKEQKDLTMQDFDNLLAHNCR